MLYCTSHTKSSLRESYSVLCWKKLQDDHQGGESMIRRAWEVMYWPGMQAAVLQESAKCSLCGSYGSALPKKPMLSHEIPQGPWKFIS